jgi:hypothetical protein
MSIGVRQYYCVKNEIVLSKHRQLDQAFKRARYVGPSTHVGFVEERTERCVLGEKVPPHFQFVASEEGRLTPT